MSKYCNVVVIGRHSCGKSTLGGRIVANSGYHQSIRGVPLKELTKQEGFELSWICDHYKDERKRRKSKDFSITFFETKKRMYSLVDTPSCRKGKKDAFYKGLALGDVAIYFTDVSLPITPPVFHLTAPFVFGIKVIIFAMSNHCSTNEDFQRRFEEKAEDFRQRSRKNGYQRPNIFFVPVDALHNENISNKSKKYSDWWPNSTLNGSGLCLYEILDSIEDQKLRSQKLYKMPFRLSICRIYDKVQPMKYIFEGRIESGELHVGKEVLFPLSRTSGHVQRIDFAGKQVRKAETGQIITFSLLQTNQYAFGPSRKEKEIGKNGKCAPSVGDCVGVFPVNEDTPKPLPVISFEAQILVIGHPGRIHLGYSPIFRCRTNKSAVHITKIIDIRDKRNGQVISTNPSYIQQGQGGVVKFSFSRRYMPKTKSVVIDPYKDVPFNGRFVLTDNNNITAVGVVKEIETSPVDIVPLGDRSNLEDETERIQFLCSETIEDDKNKNILLNIRFEKDLGETQKKGIVMFKTLL